MRQNGAWLDRLADPQRGHELRIRLRRAGAEREADAQQQARAAHERANEIERHAASLALELDAHRAALRAAQAWAEELDAVRTEAEAEVARLAATLTRIHEGGWWRLRNRLLWLMRLARWARDRSAAVRRP